MPMCDIFIPKDALDPEAERKLVAIVSDLLVDHEMRRIVDLTDDPAQVQASRERAQSIAWMFVHRTETYVAGRTTAAPYYKFVVTIPEGTIDERFPPAINRDIYSALEEAEGGKHPGLAGRVWVPDPRGARWALGGGGTRGSAKGHHRLRRADDGRRRHEAVRSDEALARRRAGSACERGCGMMTADAASRIRALEMAVYTSRTHQLGGGRTFSPVTSTLFTGRDEAVLVDAQFLADEVDGLASMIERTGRRLSTIFITHGHADHYFGADRLAARFPGARIVATQAVVDYIAANHAREAKTITAMLGEAVVLPTSSPIPLNDLTLRLEDHELQVVSVGQGDIAPSTVLHVPSLATVVSGDVTYDRIHQMLGLTGPDDWLRWVASIEAIEALLPRVVVSGHRREDMTDYQAARILNETKSYIRDFAEAARLSATADDIVAAMQVGYPEHGNVTTLHFSARAAIKRGLGRG